MDRVFQVVICLLLAVIGVGLVADEQSFARVCGAALCFSLVVSFATGRWPRVSAMASSLAGVCAFVASALFLQSVARAPSREGVAAGLVLLAFGLSGARYAWRVRFGLRLRPRT